MYVFCVGGGGGVSARVLLVQLLVCMCEWIMGDWACNAGGEHPSVTSQSLPELVIYGTYKQQTTGMHGLFYTSRDDLDRHT